MRCYVAGPMTGVELHNFPSFDIATDVLRKAGYEVVSPAEMTREYWRQHFGEEFNPAVIDQRAVAGGNIYEDFLRQDIRAISECDAVVLLPGWERSKGVARELAVARALQLDIFTYEFGVLVRVHEKAQEDAQSKPSNPKDAIGSTKLPLHLFPLTAIVWGCLAFLEGLLKYGRTNFRVVGVRASIYYDAARRHLDAWFEGEDTDPDSQLPHLAKALACIAVLIDAHCARKLNDDRMVRGGYHDATSEAAPHVARLKAQYADRTPKHYTIADNDRKEAA